MEKRILRNSGKTEVLLFSIRNGGIFCMEVSEARDTMPASRQALRLAKEGRVEWKGRELPAVYIAERESKTPVLIVAESGASPVGLVVDSIVGVSRAEMIAGRAGHDGEESQIAELESGERVRVLELAEALRLGEEIVCR